MNQVHIHVTHGVIADIHRTLFAIMQGTPRSLIILVNDAQSSERARFTSEGIAHAEALRQTKQADKVGR